MNAGFRNSFVFGPWTLEKVSSRFDLSKVDCGDPDLNEYFQRDSVDAYRAAVGFYESNDFKRMKARGTEDPKAPTIPLFFDLLRIETSAA